MNTSQNAKLKMYRSAHAVLDQKKASFQKTPRLAKMLTDLHTLLGRLDALTLEQKISVEEATITQNQRRAEMVALTEQVSGVIVVEAEFKGNLGLVGRARPQRQTLLRGSFGEAVVEAERIHDLAGDHVEAFAESEIEPGLVQALENAIEAFRVVQGTPRTITSLRAGVTAEFDRGIRKGQLLLKQIDKLMLQFVKKDPQLWDTWTSARKGKAPGTGQPADKPDTPPVSTGAPTEVLRPAASEKPQDRAA